MNISVVHNGVFHWFLFFTSLEISWISHDIVYIWERKQIKPLTILQFILVLLGLWLAGILQGEPFEPEEGDDLLARPRGDVMFLHLSNTKTHSI